MTSDPESTVYINYESRGEGNLTSGTAKMGTMAQKVTDTQQAMSNLVNAITQISNKVNEFATNSVDSFASFDQGMANVKSIVKGTADEVEKLDGLAAKMGADMPILGEEAAAGFYELASAGKSANDIMALAPQITKAAIAANADFATMAKLVTAAQDSYSLSNEKVTHTTDLFLNTVKGYKTTLPELSVSMQYAMTAASQMGVGMDYVAASVGSLRQAGLDASSAGTGLRMTLLKIGEATTSSNEKLAYFAESVTKNSDGTLNYEKTLQKMNEQLSDFDPVEKMTILQGAFGARTASATAILLNNADTLGTQAEKLNTAGAVADTYATQVEGAGNKLKILQGQMEAQEIMMGEKLLPTQIKINEAKLKFLEVLNDLPGPLGEVAIGTGMIISNAMQMVGPIALAANAIHGMTGAQWGLNAAMLANPVGIVIIAIVALTAIVAGAIYMIMEGSKWVKYFGMVLLMATGPIGLIIMIILALTGHLNFMKEIMADVGDFFIQIWEVISSAVKKYIEFIIGYYTNLFNTWKESWEKILSFVSKVLGLMKTVLKAGMKSIRNNLKNQVEKIMEIFQLWKKAKDWGKKMVQKFVEGVKDQIDKAKSGVGDAVKKIAGFFGGSPPEFGPLKAAMDNGGGEFMERYIGGMTKNMNSSTVNNYNLDARSNNSFPTGINGDEFVDDMFKRLLEKLSEMRS